MLKLGEKVFETVDYKITLSKLKIILQTNSGVD
jgi:hypothetical protein